MAFSRALLVTFLLALLALLALHVVDANPQTITGTGTGRSLLAGGGTMDCGRACVVRCRLSSRPNLCNRACGTCCSRCNCVPPGTAGNRELCPCYDKMTTRGGLPKCP